MTLGLVVGKFYPPHRGHKHLIDSARQQVDRLVVILAHHPSQTIPGELRRAWLEEIHPDCEIHRSRMNWRTTAASGLSLP